ncbi:DUF748 domain-containing protein [Bdellovibrio sp. SKB1291214]|uniref:DUF748 domain-containing protein n=1 Tax=Bdellovibrio sp. SKB1291214 TaxID=1732569 RepID=UPI000B518DE4|nr:DUF748 domain-containing protein [Bdellovibrio sp. SKB1291214]UYL09846.1 DUF748 domain-containing protein [Bdellovibrio sp. SKB1291214]
MKKVFRAFGRVHKAVWIVLIVLIAVRLALPYGIKYGINWYMGNKMENYKGHIEDFDLALYRGAYQIQDLKIWEKKKSPKQALVSVKEIDLSLAWRGIFAGKLLGDLNVDGMKLDLVDSEDKKKKDMGTGEDWKTVVGKLIPIELESFRLVNSEVHLYNNDFKVPVDVVVDRIMLSATNIKNTDNKKELLPSTMEASARLQKSGTVTAGAKLNLLSKAPAVESKFSIEKLDVTKLNDFFKGYGPFTFTSGSFSLVGEVSTRDNRIKGYVKPFFENLDVIDPNEKYDSPKRFFFETGLALSNLILRNSDNKTVATTVEFEGAMKGPDINSWDAFWGSLRNGFVEALKKTLDNTISIKDVPKKK